MNDQTQTSASLPAPRPYARPDPRPLGSVETVTAGDASGVLDQLVGSTGGFVDQTS